MYNDSAPKELPVVPHICEHCGRVRTVAAQEEEAQEHRAKPHTLAARNALALFAALMFCLSLLFDENHLLFKAVAYGAGALAYLGEILICTHFFQNRPPLKEMLMPYLFGMLYVVLGISYGLEYYQ